MRRTHFFLALLVLMLGAGPVFAQDGPPPPSPDYFPERWKEYVFEQDNVKFRFPVEPEVTASTKDESFGKVTQRNYRRRSFAVFELSVQEFPAGVNFEKMPAKELLDGMRDAGLDEIKRFEPKVVKESDLMVDGHPGRFLHVEANDGKVVRLKFFIVKNRIYFSSVEVKKGERHGSNYENDFEKVVMAFLDSVRLASADK